MTRKSKYALPCREVAYRFVNANSLRNAMSAIHANIVPHKYFQHYTKLERVLQMITDKRLYLSRLDSLSLNDLRECKKYQSQAAATKTYIACFGQGSSECAAMWGLYGKGNPLAVRIKIPGDKLIEWMKAIEIKCGDGSSKAKTQKIFDITNGKSIAREIDSLVFRDVVYASVSDEKCPDKYSTKRGNVLSWCGVPRYHCDKETEEDFIRDVQSGMYAGFVKDNEWSYERESRLSVKLKKSISSKGIVIGIPVDVLESMRFTFSPWSDEGINKIVQKIIESALESACGGFLPRLASPRFSRSVLQGSLNF